MRQKLYLWQLPLMLHEVVYTVQYVQSTMVKDWILQHVSTIQLRYCSSLLNALDITAKFDYDQARHGFITQYHLQNAYQSLYFIGAFWNQQEIGSHFNNRREKIQEGYTFAINVNDLIVWNTTIIILMLLFKAEAVKGRRICFCRSFLPEVQFCWQYSSFLVLEILNCSFHIKDVRI